MKNDELEILQVQNEIHKLLHLNNGVTAHFREDEYDISLITYNPKNNEFFLLKTINGVELSELEVYKLLLDFVRELLVCIDTNTTNESIGSPYTVTWQKAGGARQVSYFYAKGLYDLLSKFFHNKETERELFTIFEIKLNPIS